MIRQIEARHYRCIKEIRQGLGNFHVLVGPNASGKSTFLDIPSFIRQMELEGLDAAVAQRTNDIHDLFWQRQGGPFELALEVAMPGENPDSSDEPADHAGKILRYEVVAGISDKNQSHVITRRLFERDAIADELRHSRPAAETILLTESEISAGSWRSLLPGLDALIKLGLAHDRGRANAPDSAAIPVERSRTSFLEMLGILQVPQARWLLEFLRERLVPVTLESQALRRPAKPGNGARFVKNGENLPGVIAGLQEKSPEQFDAWIRHLQMALPELTDVRVVERAEDHFRYVMVIYKNDLQVPAWVLSDGTLRLMALTVLPYLPTPGATYLIDEPEANIHPRNVEIMMQSLGSLYDGQTLLATHSPAVISVTGPKNLLVFSQTLEGGAAIVPGGNHPGLRAWKGQPNLSVLFASGVLG